MNKLYVRSVNLKRELWLLILVLVLCVPVVILSNQDTFSFNAVRNIGHMIHKNALVSAKEDLFQAIPFAGQDMPLAFPRLDIIVSERDVRSLVQNPPKSMKKWKSGSLSLHTYEGKMKFRLRGDSNVDNYLYARKSFKIKLPKDSHIFGIRRFSLLPDNNAISLAYSTAYLLADSLGVITPVHLPVHLFINGESAGVYTLREGLNEQLLRNRNIMPVEILKGDRAASTTVSANTDYETAIFENEAIWEKQSSNNRIAAGDYTALAQMFSIMWGNERLPGYSLEEVLPVRYWARYALLLTLLRTAHQDNKHNQRLLFDDQLGGMLPISHDLAFDLAFFTNPSIGDKIDNPLRFEHAPLAALSKSDTFLKEYFSLAKALIQNMDKTGCIGQNFCFGKGLQNEKTKQPFPRDEARKYVHKVVAGKLPDNFLSLVSEPLRTFLARQADQPIKMNLNKECGVVYVDRMDGIKNLSALRHAGLHGRETVKVFDVGAFPGRMLPVCRNFPTLAQYCIGASTNLQLKAKPYPLYIGDFLYDDFYAETYLGTKVKVNVVKGVDENGKCDGMSSQIHKKKPQSLTKQLWSGEIVIQEPKYVYADVEILPGTRILLAKGASLIFKGRLMANGTAQNPILFEPLDDGPWGVVALVGQGTAGSVLNHSHFSGGSAWKDTMTSFLGMLSFHNTRNVRLTNSHFGRNKNADDTIHVVYSKALLFENLLIEDAQSDAVDIDISDQIELVNLTIRNAGNDCVDFMTSNAVLKGYSFNGCGDKGISVGERSKVLSVDGYIANAATGIESKDESAVYLRNTHVDSTITPLHASSKNRRFFGVGNIREILASDNYGDYGFAWADGSQVKALCSSGQNNSGKFSIGMASEPLLCADN